MFLSNLSGVVLFFVNNKRNPNYIYGIKLLWTLDTLAKLSHQTYIFKLL